MNPVHRTCKVCGHKWTTRPAVSKNRLNKQCPACKSTFWLKGPPRVQIPVKDMPTPVTPLPYEDATNQGGTEWHTCMYFDDESEVVQGCSERGYNIATIEVPLQTVDVTWRDPVRPYVEHTRPAAHPSERGCYTTMPLVLCWLHFEKLAHRLNRQLQQERAVG